MKDRKNYVLIDGGNSIEGELSIPGDKSISHRAIMLASLSKSRLIIKNILESDDINSTINAFRQLGIRIDRLGPGEVEVYGRGLDGLSRPEKPIDCGNSGTSMRLLAGILSAEKFDSVLLGDKSLNSRPMARIIEPLELMGAKIESKDSKPPLLIKGGRSIKAIEYKMKLASAQVKSSILLSSLRAGVDSRVFEDIPSRNHTELMIDYFKAHDFLLDSLYIPSDISSAAYFMVLSLISRSSSIVMKGIGINESRSGIIKVLRAMGGRIEVKNKRTVNGESMADIYCLSSKLKGLDISGPIIANIIDELPIIAVAACFAQGKTRVRDAQELRVKETDRIGAIVSELKKFGAIIKEFDDGFEIEGCKDYRPARVESFGDHRIAMSLSVMASAIDGRSQIIGADSVNISFPDFYKILKQN